MPRGRFRRTLRGRLTDRLKLWLAQPILFVHYFGAFCGALDSACGIQRSRHGSRPSLPEGNEHGFKDFFRQFSTRMVKKLVPVAALSKNSLFSAR